ncbi:SDR family NAD(P)-dependent oxidoreductase [Chloroflexota bacterium]
MDLKLQGKSVIVTGGGSNIGRGIVLGFAGEGSNVAIADIDPKQGDKVKKECEAINPKGKFVAVQTDVTNWDSVQAMAKKTNDELGAIDILINNAGGAVNRKFVDTPREKWERDINLNLWGTINCTRAVLDYMMPRTTGVIINITSDGARVGDPTLAVYGAAKAGVISLAKSLSRELSFKYKIRFNVISPGASPPKDLEKQVGEKSWWAPGGELEQAFGPQTAEMQEKMIKMGGYVTGRLGTAEDIANAVLFFSSDAVAGHIAGQVLSVSGGYSMVG